MRKSIKQFVKICAETLPMVETIYEFGALQTPGQEGFADLRPYFPGKKYVGADMQTGPGVDVVLDLHDIKLGSETVGTVLMLDTLEHVEYVRKAVEEAHRILKPNGILVISSVMNFPIHDFPYDYWRFTPEAFKSLLKPFDLSIVEIAGENHFPHTVVGIGIKGTISDEMQRDFMDKLKKWKKRQRFGLTGFGLLLTPTILMPLMFGLYRKILGIRHARKPAKKG